VRALDQVQHPRRLDVLAHRQFDTELGRPGDDRAEQQLIVKEDDDPMVKTAAPIADQSPASLALAMNDPTPQRDRRIADRDRFGRDDEEPAA